MACPSSQQRVCRRLGLHLREAFPLGLETEFGQRHHFSQAEAPNVRRGFQREQKLLNLRREAEQLEELDALIPAAIEKRDRLREGLQ